MHVTYCADALANMLMIICAIKSVLCSFYLNILCAWNGTIFQLLRQQSILILKSRVVLGPNISEQKPDIYRRDRLGLYADIQIIFGTVYTD